MYKKLLGCIACAVLSFSVSAKDPEYVFKLHHFLPPVSMAHTKIFIPWAEKVNQESNGRIQIDIYPAMQLGGKPQQLFDQTRKGVVDMSWSVGGLLKGRFPKASVFELPFMVTTAEGVSQAMQEYAETEMQDELKDVHLLSLFTHARGSIHSLEPIQEAQDFQGKKIQMANQTLAQIVKIMGGEPVFLPLTQVPSALSKGVVESSILPFEALKPMRIHEIVDYHLEIGGERGLYTQFFLFTMNKEAYSSLPDDLKQVIDNNSGIANAKRFGRLFDEYELIGRDAAVAEGNQFYMWEGSQRDDLIQKLKPITEKWILERNKTHGDGDALYQKANSLLDKYK